MIRPGGQTVSLLTHLSSSGPSDEKNTIRFEFAIVLSRSLTFPPQQAYRLIHYMPPTLTTDSPTKTPHYRPYNRERLESQAIHPLTKAQEQYARDIVAGKRKRNYAWDKLPLVQQAVKDLQQQANALICYDLSKAMRSCEHAVQFAYDKGNPMAVVKGTELICKLAGLLIEKHEVLTISLKEALDLAKQRAEERRKQQPLQINPSQPAAEDGGGMGAGGTKLGSEPPVVRDLCTG